jgi:hypothetical protein
MATITASATGGNWNATTAWVGGVVPTSLDDVIINSSSGNITVTDNRSCLTIDFTGYTGTFMINNGFTLTVFGTSITLGSGMTFTSGTTGVLSTLGNQIGITITFNGITIPRLTIGKTSTISNQTVTVVGTTPIVQNLVVNNVVGSATVTLTGSIINITSSLNIIGAGAMLGNIVNFSGTCTISALSNTGTVVNGFTVLTSSSLEMLSNIGCTGPVVFSGTATLNPNLFTFFMFSSTNSINSGTVTWYNFSYNVNGGFLTLLSDLNIANNLGHLNSVFTGAFSINIGGTTVSSSPTQFNPTTIINFIGTGVIINGFVCQSAGGVVNINTTNPYGYIFGSLSFPQTTLINTTLNLIGTSVAQVFSTTSHTLWVSTSILNTNNTSTGANIVGGSEIIWGNLLFTNSLLTVSQPSTFLGNLTVSPTLGVINGAKILVSGNISLAGGGLQGTSTIEMNGSVNRTISGGIIQNNLIINKSSGATITVLANITLGIAGRSLSMNTTTLFGTTSLTIAGNNFTINNSSGSSFYNLTNNTANTTISINNPIFISNNLTVFSNINFAGSSGWTCANFLCSVAGSIITFLTGVTYGITNSLNAIGTAISRITFQSSNRATFNGTADGAVLTYSSGTTPLVGMTLSHTSGAIPAGFSNLLPARPVIESGGPSTFALSNTVSPSTGAISLTAGNKAILVLSAGASQNLAYITTQDIDSSGGQTIYAFESLNDTNLFRTINWERLVAPNSNPIGYIFLT